MARKLRVVEVGREVSLDCGTLLSEQNGGGGGGGNSDTVVSVRLEEETRPDGTVVRRSVISQRPRVSKIWMKNSTSGGECASALALALGIIARRGRKGSPAPTGFGSLRGRRRRRSEWVNFSARFYDRTHARAHAFPLLV